MISRQNPLSCLTVQKTKLTICWKLIDVQDEHSLNHQFTIFSGWEPLAEIKWMALMIREFPCQIRYVPLGFRTPTSNPSLDFHSHGIN